MTQEYRPPIYPIEVETFVATMAKIAASQGDAAGVAVLAEAKPSIDFNDSRSDWGNEYCYFVLRLSLEPSLYGRLSDEREKLTERLSKLSSEISSALDEYFLVNTVVFAPAMEVSEGWRENARAWLRGEGINNQGRVRSDNIAARQHDGLLFRSPAEIFLYNALKAKGVFLAPLPVFLRGGATYQRLEPDFVLISKGVIMVVEIDGATVHRESPAEAHLRTQGLLHDGVRVERVAAAECATRQDADRCATKLVAALEGYRALRT
jgi:hypothetical protein